MAWAEKRPSGRWLGRYRDVDGRKRWTEETYSHKAKAVRAAAAEEDKSRKAKWRDPDAARQTWGEWCDVWWPSRGVEPTTQHRDGSRLERYLRPRWDPVALGKITRHDAKAWAVELRGKGLAASSVQKVMHLMSASLSAAVDAEILDYNPFSRLKLPPASQGSERYLTKAEYARVRAELSTTYDQLIADVLVSTGTRWGEFAGAHWHRVDQQRGMLLVCEVLDRKTGRVKPYPKGRKIREVPLPAHLVDALAAIDRPVTCGRDHVEGVCRSGLLLSSASGHPIGGNNWYNRVWLPAVALAEIGHCRVHDLRHTFASWQIQAGTSLEEIGRLLGHLSPKDTQRYAHLAKKMPASVRRAVPAHDLPTIPVTGAPRRRPNRRIPLENKGNPGRPRQDSNLRPTD